MAKKNKDSFVRLVSSAGTGYTRIAKKSRNMVIENRKISLKKYDPIKNGHYLFVEKKFA